MKVGFVCRRARNSFSTAPFFEDLYINCTMSRRIATLHSSEKSRSRSSSPPNDDEKRQQGFFVGGSEQSGNLVLGPDSTHNEDIVSKFFSSARAHGAESLTPEENARFGTRDAVKFASGSKGYRLGNTIQPSELVESNISSDSVPQEVTLIMWENGFTVDGGPLRLYSDLPNHSFLHSISEGHIPNEIIRQYPGKTIDIRMERRYQPYVVKSKPFSGQGQRLGEIVPTIVSAGNLEQNTNNDANPANSECVDFHCVKKAQETIKLTNEEPVTHVQIRLPSGRRIVGQFNHNHTVGDIRNFLIIAAPDYAFVPFNLMTTFPNKVIEQENVSLKEADRLIQSRIPTAVNMIFVDLIHAGKASDFPFQ
ncbi:NSFL1 cofactor [Dirofilaria immitis]